MINTFLKRNLFIFLCLSFVCAVLVAGCTDDLLTESENTEQGEDKNEAGAESSASVSMSVDVVTATTASFNGYIDVPTSDLPFSQIIMYYSDETTFSIDSAESVFISSFDADGKFSHKIMGLKHNTKYNYCVLLEVLSDKIYSDVGSFVTGAVSLGNFTVVPGLFDAEISGNVAGLSGEDKHYIQVGILYSSVSDKINSGEAEKVYVNEISEDGDFSVCLTELNNETRYFYCGYIRQDDDYLYSAPLDFITAQHPYDVPQDLDASSAKDLSLSTSANCYIVSSSGSYKFKATKGNSAESVGNVASARILWESFGTADKPGFCDLISGVCYKEDYIVFKTADVYKEGNALIAALDAEGNVLWSWHIWLTDLPEEQVYFNDAGIMMDRNLGATSAAVDDVGSLGLLYQWGRKDPFLGCSTIDGADEAESTLVWPAAVCTDPVVGTIEYSIAHPTTFISYDTDIVGYVGNQDWCYASADETDNTRWVTSVDRKSVYDPCPAGWRVPDGGKDGVWSKALGSSSDIFYGDRFANYKSRGMNFTGQFGDDANIWYPSVAYRIANGRIYFAGIFVYCWSASVYRTYAHLLRFSNYLYLSPSDYNNRVQGLSVRCIKE